MGMATSYSNPKDEPFDPATAKPGMAFKCTWGYDPDLGRRAPTNNYKYIRYVTTYLDDHIFEYWYYPKSGGKSQGFSIFNTDTLVRDPENDWPEE